MIGGLILVYAIRRGIFLQFDACKYCKYIIVSPSISRCTECGTELSTSTIKHKGGIAKSTRLILVFGWTLLLMLPTRLLLLYAEPHSLIPNYAAIYVFDSDLSQPSVGKNGLIFPIDSEKQRIPNVERYTICVPSWLTEETLKNSAVHDASKLDCLITVVRKDGIISRLLISSGATQFIVNPGEETEQVVDHPPLVSDIAQLAGVDALITDGSAVKTGLMMLHEIAFKMLRVPIQRGGNLSIFTSDLSYYLRRSAKGRETNKKREARFLPIILINCGIWIFGIIMILAIGHPRVRPAIAYE